MELQEAARCNGKGSQGEKQLESGVNGELVHQVARQGTEDAPAHAGKHSLLTIMPILQQQVAEHSKSKSSKSMIAAAGADCMSWHAQHDLRQRVQCCLI